MRKFRRKCISVDKFSFPENVKNLQRNKNILIKYEKTNEFPNILENSKL